MNKAIERFITYVKIDTQSNENSESTPSEMKELNLSKLLQKELKELGIESEIDKFGRLYAHIPGEKGLPTIGLNSHVDTATEISGANVKPRMIENYDGSPIKLNDEFTMDPVSFPSLLKHIGDNLIVTGGDTLLGGDDKAGDAIIMSAIAYFVEHPEAKHHPISILFTPDEEIGRGPEHFDAKKFGADFAYTIDGDYPEFIESENFNAAHATITIKGVSIHPGEAKGKMVNAARIASEFDSLLSPEERPELTDGHDGFNHLISIEGGCEEAVLRYIIRNHDKGLLEKQKQEFVDAVATLKRRYPKAVIDLDIGDDYRNMKEIFEKDPRALEHAYEVYRKMGINPVNSPIRGGTDGATFSFLGCPTPNLGTGSYNHHGRFEYLSERDFLKMVDIVIALLEA